MPQRYFTITVPLEVHQRARRAAFDAGKALWKWGGDAIIEKLERDTPKPKRRKK